MKRHFFAALLVCTLCLCLGSFCRVAASQTPIIYDGWVLPVAGSLQNGTTYVPFRQFCETVGENQVTWDGQQQCATVQGGVNAAFYANTAKAWFSGSLQTLTGKNHLRDGTMYVPLRGLAEAMACQINYDAASGQVSLSTEPADTDNDIQVYWLSRIIHAESSGESYQGKLAVGNVILNRVKSADFPNTIYDVIFDRKNGVQFTPTANGTIYQIPSAESIAAAKECLAGSDIAKDCLYFFNPSTATKADWIVQNCIYYTSIGNHDFYTAR